MNPDLSHLRLTVVDFLGVFLPGVIWTILIATLSRSVTVKPPDEVTPIFVVRELLAAPELGVSFYVAYSLLALIVGYVAKTIAIPPSEKLARLFDAPVAYCVRRFGWKSNAKEQQDDAGNPCDNNLRNSIRFSDYRFPYHAYNSEYPACHYYARILDFVKDRLGVNWVYIPRSQIFATCKRMLKLYAARLWEEAEYREAEVRLLASLFLASLFSLALGATQSFYAGNFNPIWVWVSAVTTLLLCLAFRARRRLEVESVYFAFLSSLPLIPAAGEASERLQVASRKNIEKGAKPHSPGLTADA